jgi:hypothetical protein
MDRGAPVVLRPMTFWMMVIGLVLAGMFGMWWLGSAFPGQYFGVTSERKRIANRITALRRNRMNRMRRR